MTREQWITFCWIYGSVCFGNCLRNLKAPDGNQWVLLISGSTGSMAILYFLSQIILEAGK